MALMGGQRDMIQNEGRNVMDVNEHEALRLNELEDIEKLLLVVHEIAETSEDAESVRLAFCALTSTKLGRDYLEEHPIPL